MVVVGVQNLYQQLCQVFFLYGLLIIALVEGVQAEGIHGLCVPDTKGIHYVIAIAYYRKVAGDSPYGLIALLDKMVLAVLIDLYVYIAAELDDLRVLRTAELKGIAVHKPVVGNLFLIAVLNFLLEHTIAVTDTAAVCRIAQGCQRIQEAGCQSSQTAISQSCVRLLILDHVQIAAQLLQSFLYFVIIGQVNQVIAKSTAHQKFHGHVIHDLRILLFHLLLGRNPCVDDRVLGSQRYRMKNLVLCCLFNGCPVQSLHVVNYASLKEFLVKGSLTHNSFLLFDTVYHCSLRSQ